MTARPYVVVANFLPSTGRSFGGLVVREEFSRTTDGEKIVHREGFSRAIVGRRGGLDGVGVALARTLGLGVDVGTVVGVKVGDGLRGGSLSR